jgi:hypothetical protein
MALSELARVLRPDGGPLLSVPVVDAWDETYEDPGQSEPDLRDLRPFSAVRPRLH